MKTGFRFAGRCCLASLLGIALFAVAATAEDKPLEGHVPAAVSKLNLPPLGRLAATTQLRLAIGLPFHDPESIHALFNQVYDPASTNFHRYLTPAQITERFGPTESEYQAVIRFAETNGLAVVATQGNRLLLDVLGKVSDVEKAFHVTLRTYQHPTEARQFFAPDVEPTVDASLPVLNVSGLNNYSLPHSNFRSRPATAGGPSGASAGSGFFGNYLGYDFRRAYAPGVGLTGAGQMVGLFEVDGYYASDITNYENLAGISPPVTLQNVLLDGSTGIPSYFSGGAEVALDIEMAIAMAPGLSKVVVFEGPPMPPGVYTNENWDDILNCMAASNEIKQLSCSWGFSGATDATMHNIFLTMGLEGQSFFLGSGDGDAFVGDLMGPDDDTNITTVGGTELTMTGSGAAYSSELVWNSGYSPQSWWYGGGGFWGSGGGISTRTSIPPYQQGISMVSNQGSTTMRNVPDVAMVANGVEVYCDGGIITNGSGTSIAAPLWAGFTALANQKAANNGQPPVGFLNPALYQFAKGPLYGFAFHDITNGNNFSSNSPSKFSAVPGYDLCTGLGTPNGINMINALLSFGSSTVWVDYNYTGSTQNGTYGAPYTTLVQAVAAAPSGGQIWFRTAGLKVEIMTG